MDPTDVPIAIHVVDDVVAVTRTHLLCSSGQAVHGGPRPFVRFSVSHTNTGQEIVGELEATGRDMRG